MKSVPRAVATGQSCVAIELVETVTQSLPLLVLTSQIDWLDARKNAAILIFAAHAFKLIVRFDGQFQTESPPASVSLMTQC
jgi:hypothetical protein